MAAVLEEQAGSLLQLVETLVQEIHPTTKFHTTLDSLFDRDLGLDSLARVELIARVERHFSIFLPEQTFAEVQTPRQLLVALLAHQGHQRTAESPQPVLPATRIVKNSGFPDHAETLIDVLRWQMDTLPDGEHIRLLTEGKDDEILSYRSLWQESLRLAAGLRALGVEPGDRVAIMLPTGREYFLSFFGILLAGGVPVPLYPPVRIAQLEDHLNRHCAILNNCQARVLITVIQARTLVRLLKAQTAKLQHIVTVDELDRMPPEEWLPPLQSQDIAFLQYTSGSTGTPKGVVLTHANLIANIRAMGMAVAAKPQDVFVSWLPLYHDMGLIGAWLGSLYHGMCLVLMSPLAFLSHPLRWLQAIQNYQGTLSAAPNFAYELCSQRLTDTEIVGLDLRSWRAAFNGAEPVSPETINRFCQRFEPYGFRRESMTPVYGLAECSVGLAIPPLQEGPRIDAIERQAFMTEGKAIPANDLEGQVLRFVMCGQPLPGHEIRIVDASGRELPERHEGRLQFRGPSATSGYYGNPEATAKLVVRDGWLVSGDLAYIADGEIYLTGRSRDIIIRAGRNIYPHELEEAVGEIAGVRRGRVAVFGAQAAHSGTEKLVVMAELQEKSKSEEVLTQIHIVITELIGSPADEVVFAPGGTILKTSSGKVRRSACRELYERGRVGTASAPVWQQLGRLGWLSVKALMRRGWHTLKAYSFSIYTWLLIALTIGLCGTAVLVLPNSADRWRCCRWLISGLARFTRTPIKIEGLEHLPAPEQTVIYVANHASYLDAFVLLIALPRQVSFVAKAELARNPVLKLLLTRLSVEFVERYDTEKAVVDAKRLQAALADGRSLLFFPEGTFSRRPGLMQFHLGAFDLAAELAIQLVPVVLRGTRSMLRDGSWQMYPGHLRVRILPALTMAMVTAENNRNNKWATALKLRDAARQQILQYCGEPDGEREKTIRSPPAGRR